MATIVFIDEAAYKPYSPEVLRTQALGGSEASVVRVAEKLSETHTVFVACIRRPNVERFGATYVPLSYLPKITNADAVIVFRSVAAVPRARAAFPGARLWLWMEDLVSPLSFIARQRLRRLLASTDTGLVFPSHYHRLQATGQLVRSRIEEYAGPRLPRMEVIANPTDDDLQPDGGHFDPNKLVFFSSPHKGGKQTLEAFAHLRKSLPEMTLYVAIPGYWGWKSHSARSPHEFDNVVNLGSISHYEIMAHVRGALCVFYPNNVYPETFGNVYAEGNAVGTPVLTHAFGAAPEVLQAHPEQLVRLRMSGDELRLKGFDPNGSLDREDLELLRTRVEAWRAGSRPTVRLADSFRTRAVSARWEQVLGV